MLTATISHAKNNLSALLVRVQDGESVLILDRDRPVARLVPLEAKGANVDERLRALEREGVLRRRVRLPGTPRTLQPAVPLRPVDAVAALLADRSEER